MVSLCLNPCFNGIRKNAGYGYEQKHAYTVLILVLMEYEKILLLALTVKMVCRLNPCFNGIRKNLRKKAKVTWKQKS